MKVTGRKIFKVLLMMAMVIGLFPGMGLTAYAAGGGTDPASPPEVLLTTITATGKEQASYSTANVATVSFSYTAGGSSAYLANWGWWGYGWSATVNAAEGYTITKCKFYDDANREATDSLSPFVVETTEEDKTPRINDTPIDGGNFQSKGIKKIEVYGYVAVTDVTLNPSTAQTIDVDGKVSFTATVSPDNATDKTVKWSTTGGVTLYSDENCTAGNEIGADATSTLTVYAKGTAAGSASVTATSNEDSTKSASCNVTVNKADPTAPTGLTATYGQKLSDVALPTGWTWVDSTTSVGNVVSPAATFKANFAGDDNYNAASNVDVTVTVSKADATTAMQAASVSIAGTSGKTATVSYTLPDGASYGAVTNSNTEFFTVDTTSGIVLTAAKNWTASDWATDTSKTFTVLVSGATNYNDYTLTVTVTPTYKATQTITAANVTTTYGDTGIKVNASTDGDGAISYAVKDGSGEYIGITTDTGILTLIKAGTGTVVVTAAETATYAETTKEVTVTINKAAPTAATVTANNLIYDGNSKPLVTVMGETLGGEMQYALGTQSGATGEYSKNIPTGTGAGTYYVWYKVVGDENHNDTEPKCVTATISYNVYNVVADNQEWTKGSSNTLTIRFKATNDDRNTYTKWKQEVYVDEVKIDAANYTAKSGSLVIDLKPAYLEKLSEGKHKLSVGFNDIEGLVTASFTVKAKSSGGGGSSTPEKKTDNVVTCQMAGYPANYAWNESAKACQPGYIDANGVFHSTAKGSNVPNTYDKGVTGNMISFFAATSFAFIAAYMLRKY